MVIDINCDLGEGMPNDAALMPYISSANIACGFHAGDEDTMRRTIALAVEHGVSIGAHPGFPDKKNFGRTEMMFPEEDIVSIVSEQVYIMLDLVFALGGKLQHVKPHGALYNMAARDLSLASAIANAIKDIDEHLILFGLSGSKSIEAAQLIGLRTANEVFADRTYTNEGTLTPRQQSGALITDPAAMEQQVLQMIREQKVTSLQGKTIPLQADTICIHGDGEHAIVFAQQVHQLLQNNHITIQSFNR
ncbi:5-oxoprolinase subunit PxpA [Sediminibacterium sp. KACHI17]|jgi:5-oxoprolinase (ATP-hydrolysing) subunit A|uniref:5-oxoprolinase subunit PxpA n=1 Tax=Sediminibacterium sp. KACHI17 TaxID=1751071 RepID=A0AAT9GKK4_9BACT